MFLGWCVLGSMSHSLMSLYTERLAWGLHCTSFPNNDGVLYSVKNKHILLILSLCLALASCLSTCWNTAYVGIKPALLQYFSWSSVLMRLIKIYALSGYTNSCFTFCLDLNIAFHFVHCGKCEFPACLRYHCWENPKSPVSSVFTITDFSCLQGFILPQQASKTLHILIHI